MTNPANFYAAILGVARPWQVTDVVVRSDLQEVHVDLALEAQAATRCPTCGKSVARYDSRKRRWRHLDMCQYKTLMSADVPRVQCPEHGVLQVRVPWAEPGGRCTELFESMVIDWLKEASILSVARQIGMSWDVVAGIQDRAVRRGLERRDQWAPRLAAADRLSKIKIQIPDCGSPERFRSLHGERRGTCHAP